jgi:hypothetical protein
VDSLLPKLLTAARRPIASIRSQDPCGCNKSLTDEELLSLYLYTTEDAKYSYRPINSALSANNWVGTELEVQIGCIDSALGCLSPYSGECYRTEEENGRIHTKAKRILALANPPSADDVVEVFVEFFMSSSLDPALALRGKAVQIVITGIAAGRDITHLSHFPGESEILFGRGARFLILEVESKPESFLIYLGEI